MEDVKPCGHESELQSLKDEIQKHITDKEKLTTQVTDQQQQLEREQRLVKHTKKAFDKYKDQCVYLQNKNEQLEKLIRRLRRNKVGLEALGKELSGAIVKHYVSESLASVLKSDDAIHFSLNELQEVEEGLITKIQNCSEEHNHPLFQEFVLKYLEEKYKDAPKAEEEDDKEDEEEDEDKEDDKDDKGDDDDEEDDDDQGGAAGKDAEKKDDDEDEEEEHDEPPQSKEVKIKRFNDKSQF